MLPSRIVNKIAYTIHYRQSLSLYLSALELISNRPRATFQVVGKHI